MSYMPQIKALVFTTPLNGIVDRKFPIIGTFREIGAGETFDVVNSFPISNQHLYILVNSITTGGDLIITGTSLSESTALPVVGDTETISINTTNGQYYQTSKKWWEITHIDTTSNTIVDLNYDYGVVGYPDFGNRDFQVLGYRVDAYSQSDTPDFRIILFKVKDDGNKKMSIVNLEEIGVDSGNGGNQIIDFFRTGIYDRSYNPDVTNIWLNNSTLTFKQLDFNSYFQNNENTFLSSTKDEGVVMEIKGAPSAGISGVDYISVEFFYTILY
jgi:hypothetical protein